MECPQAYCDNNTATENITTVAVHDGVKLTMVVERLAWIGFVTGCVVVLTLQIPNVMLYVMHVYKLWSNLRLRAWVEGCAKQQTLAESSMLDWGTEKRNVLNERWVFAGPTNGWDSQGWDQWLTHIPIYTFKVIYFVLFRFPKMIRLMLINRIFVGNWIPDDISDQKLYELVISTPLIIISKHDEKKNTLTVRFPKDLPCKFLTGASPAGLEITFDTDTGRVLTAMQHEVPILIGTKLKNCGVSLNAFILAQFHLALTTWIHPKSHIMAERNARQILRTRTVPLEPSSRFVVSLHDGLLYNSFAPGAENYNPLSMLANFQSLLDSLDCPLPHDLSASKMNISRYFRFAYLAHKSVHYWIRALGYAGINGEYMFHNTVQHSIDHQLMYEILEPLHFYSIDGSGSVRSFLSSQIFVECWIPRIVNPFEPELLKEYYEEMKNLHSREVLRRNFYCCLYEGLREIDEQYANEIAMSTSW